VSGGAVVWTSRPTLSSEASRQLIDVAVAEAAAMGVRATVVIVDESGVLKEVSRMDGAPLVSVQTALDKAYAAAAIGRVAGAIGVAGAMTGGEDRRIAEAAVQQAFR
jgi:glc operon protein GlcG